MTTHRSTPPTDPAAPWTLDEFVDRLNTQVPLGNAEDARRASAWNPRLVRHYTTSKALSAPEKLGRQAFYGPRHLDEARRLTSLQDAGLTSKSVVMFTSQAAQASGSEAVASFTASASEAPEGGAMHGGEGRRNQALALLNHWQGQGAPSLQASASAPVTGAMNMFAPPEPVFSTVNLMSEWRGAEAPPPPAFTPTAPVTVEQWHRWSPLPGLDMAVRNDLWGREEELRQLLTQWAQRPS